MVRNNDDGVPEFVKTNLFAQNVKQKVIVCVNIYYKSEKNIKFKNITQ